MGANGLRVASIFCIPAGPWCSRGHVTRPYIPAATDVTPTLHRLNGLGRSLADEDYLQEVIPAPEFGGSFVHPSSLRGYGIDVSYRC